MKKIYFSILAVLLLFQIAEAQLSLSQISNEPVVGDTNRSYLVDTGLVNIKTINAVSGNNALWDFSSLSVLGNSITSTVYSSTASASSATNFPGCTFVQSNSSFYKSVTTPSTQTELLGSSIIGASLNFTNPAIVSKYPFTYSNSYTDSYGGTVTYTSNGTFSGNITVNADGTGTLNLPNGQIFTNVLRVKTTQLTTVSGVIFVPVTVRITNYDYYHASQKYPIFNVNYNSIAILTPTVSATIRANTKSTIVGLNENSIQNSDLNIYPNPLASDLNIVISDFYKAKKIKIFSNLGSLVYVSNYSSQINISQLETGIYFVEIETDKGIVRKKIVKQ